MMFLSVNECLDKKNLVNISLIWGFFVSAYEGSLSNYFKYHLNIILLIKKSSESMCLLHHKLTPQKKNLNLLI